MLKKTSTTPGADKSVANSGCDGWEQAEIKTPRGGNGGTV